MGKISQLAQVAKGAKIAGDVEIGPFAIVEDGVEIASGVRIWPNAYICSGTSIGEGTEVHIGAVLGHLPQDLTFDTGKKTFLKIGRSNVIREYATIHRATKEGMATTIGDG